MRTGPQMGSPGLWAWEVREGSQPEWGLTAGLSEASSHAGQPTSSSTPQEQLSGGPVCAQTLNIHVKGWLQFLAKGFSSHTLSLLC